MKTISQSLLRTVFILITFSLFTGCTSSKTIVNGLDEREANEILVFLSNKGIAVSKVQNLEAGGGAGSKMILWDIQVPEDQANEAMALLNQAGLPRRRSQSLLNIFTGGSLVPSELQEKIRYQAGLAEQIASVIRKIDGVLDTEVQISFPEEDPLHPGKTKGKVTASVYVKHTGVLDDPNAHLVSKIKRLVAASVPALDYDNVTVIGDRARYSTLPSEELGGVEEAMQHVSVWTIILAKESVTRFQIIFFSFLTLLLLLLLSLLWLLWKIAPLMAKHGGFKQLFHIQPIPLETPEDVAAKESAEKIEEAEKQLKNKAENEDNDKNIDVT